MKKTDYIYYQQKAISYLNQAKIDLTEVEKNMIEVADFGLNSFESLGLLIHTYINTQRVCAKELVMLPNQTCPEHLHPNTIYGEGKEETFRCRFGLVNLYIEGESSDLSSIKLPNTSVTVYHQIVLTPGMQYTIYPNSKHWFRAGSEGAIITEFSTRSTDEYDIFTDERIQRVVKIEDNL